jgi:hypothetical protein
MQATGISHSVRSIVYHSEVEQAFDRVLDFVCYPKKLRREIFLAVNREFVEYINHPEFNGCSLVFKLLMRDDELTIRSTPSLLAYETNCSLTGWRTFYCKKAGK